MLLIVRNVVYFSFFLGLALDRSSIKVRYACPDFSANAIAPSVCSVWSWSSLLSEYSPCHQTELIPVKGCLDAKSADRPGRKTCYQQELDWQATQTERGWIANNCLPARKEKPKSQIVFCGERCRKHCREGIWY